MKTVAQWIVVLLAFCGSLSAEMRMWRDVDGTLFEGEFDKELLGDIRVKDSQGRARMIPIDQLSKADLEYVITQVPPVMDIDFKKRTRQRPEMEWTINDDVTMLYTCMVRIDKKSDLPCHSKLTAELFVLGEEVDGDNYIVMHRETSVFVFPDGDDSFHEFTTKEIPFRYYPTWGEVPSYFRGQTYLGYIVAVYDSAGNLLESKWELPRLMWLVGDLESSIPKLREIAINGRGSIHSRHFNSSFRKTETPRIKWHRRMNYF